MRILYHDFVMPHLLKDNDNIVGGAAVQWKAWFRGFRDNDFNIGLLTFKGAKSYINKRLDFDIVESYDPKKGIKKIRTIYYFIPSLYKAIKLYKPDYIIQASAKFDTALLMIISKLTGTRFIHRVAHDTHVDQRIYNMLEKKAVLIFNFGLKYADYIFAQNSYQYTKLKEKYPSKKIFVIPNPFEVSTQIKDILPLSKRSYISWVANFRHMKNMPALLNIAKQLPNVKFKIAGKRHYDIDETTEEAIKELKELNNVEFVGYLKRTEIKPFFQGAIALLNTSHYEGFSNTFLEAWSFGVPVVSTKNVNPDEIISTNNLGKIVDNYNELADGINYILRLNENEYKDLSINCFKYVKKYHDPKMLALKFVTFLENDKT